MLRQYFMSLRTVGQWKNLASHWIDVASSCSVPLSPTSTDKPANDEWKKPRPPTRNPLERLERLETTKTWTSFLQSRVGLNKAPIDDDSDSENGDDGVVDDSDAVDEDDMDFEILLMRKFWGRWARKAGVKSSVCDPAQDVDLAVDWTRTIAPVLEGRIKLVTA